MRARLRFAGAVAGVAALLLCTGMVGLKAMSRRPGFCGSCHFMAPYYRSWVSSEFPVYRHSVASISCQSCHPRSVWDLVHDIAVTVSGNYSQHLPTLKLSKEQCLACHGNYRSLARRTAVLKINPHASHLGEEECYQCHKMHGKSPGLKYCTTCHHTGQLSKCSRCHKDRKPDGFRSLR